MAGGALKLKRAPAIAVGLAATALLVYLLVRGPTAAPSIASSFGASLSGNSMIYDADDKPYEDLIKWLKKSGADFGSVSGHARALAGGGRGLFATKAIAEGDEIIRIPAECWISHRSILRSSPCAHVLREDPVVHGLIQEDQTWAVVIGLEYERHNPYSQWLEYLHFMRRQESTLWWTKAELEELHSPKMLEDTLVAKKDLDDTYNRIYPHLFTKYPTMWNAQENSRESFYWSALTMWGRAFNVAGWNSSVGTEYGLVPIADLLNHDGGRPSTWTMEYKDTDHKGDPSAYTFSANRDAAKGQEIMISYGDHRASYNFFMYCGFIPFGQTYGDYNGLVILRNGVSVLEVAIGNDGRVNEKFLNAFAAEAGVSKTEAVEMLLEEMNARLAAYPTSYADDLEAYGAQGLEYKTWATLTYRTRFKRIYWRFAENLAALAANGVDIRHQSHDPDDDSASRKINRKKKVRKAAEFALDEFQIELKK